MNERLLAVLIEDVGLQAEELEHFAECSSCSVYDIDGGPYRCPENPIEKPRVLEARARRTVTALGRFAGTIPPPSAIERVMLQYEDGIRKMLQRDSAWLR